MVQLVLRHTLQHKKEAECAIQVSQHMHVGLYATCTHKIAMTWPSQHPFKGVNMSEVRVRHHADGISRVHHEDNPFGFCIVVLPQLTISALSCNHVA